MGSDQGKSMPELLSGNIFGGKRGYRTRRMRGVPGRALLHVCRREIIRCVQALPGGICATEGRPHVLFAMPSGTVWQRDGAVEMHKCPVGKVSGASKSTDCMDCDAGKSSDSEGSAKCT